MLFFEPVAIGNVQRLHLLKLVKQFAGLSGDLRVLVRFEFRHDGALATEMLFAQGNVPLRLGKMIFDHGAPIHADQLGSTETSSVSETDRSVLEGHQYKTLEVPEGLGLRA